MDEQLRALLPDLRCPLSGAALEVLPPEECERVRERAARGELLHLDGSAVRDVRDVIATPNRSLVYRVDDGIAVLLGSSAIRLSPSPSPAQRAPVVLREEARRVQSFYDQIGWREEEGVFADTKLFEDLRAVSGSYIHKCHQRVGRHLPRRGRYLLDAASGPVHFPEYREYSREFDARICVDLSFAALRAARRNLGERGIYLLADITNLPLADGVVDAAISLHTIYHVARDAQAKAFQELQRVVRPGSSVVVVYSWGLRKSRARRAVEAPVRAAAFLANLPRRALRRARRLVAGTPPPPPVPTPDMPTLYFHAFTYAEMRRMLVHDRVEFLVWRSVGPDFLRHFVHGRLLGAPLLSLVYQVEEMFPRLCGRIGQYPMIILRT